MLKRLAIVAIMNVGVLACTQKPLPVQGNDNHQQAQKESNEPSQGAGAIVASEVDKENADNVERYAYYEAHPKEYLKAAFAPANFSNWILAALGVVGGFMALSTLRTFNLQTSHIVTSERAWMVATMKTDQQNLILAPIKGPSPMGATCIFKNEGKTHAFIVEIGGAVEVIGRGETLPDKPPPYDPANVTKWGGWGIPIPADQAFMRFATKTTENSIEIFDGSQVLWAYGYIKYLDVFSKNRIFRRKIRETKYCFRLQLAQPTIGTSAQFVIEGPPEYNRAT
jgi:hypothetical protein